MVSTFGALVLFFICAGSAIGQRKVNRNISVGTSEVKYTVNFDCPDEFGYYPHPSDCTQYYVCVFGGALLESCTGGLMYSHELQTCDWPRNVGCDGTGEVAVKATVSSSSTPSRSSSTESRTRYTPRPPPPPAQPAAVVTSRGQPRQLHHNQQQQEIIKSHQLYVEEEEEALPPPSEEISDRQQRFYRGQPSTVGQVQRDRDGIRHTNAIPSYSGRGEKIGVISFGTQQQQLQPYSDLTDVSNNDLTNDVTLTRRKIRHKRQAQRSRHPVEPAWHGGNPHKKSFSPHPSPAVLELQPPPFTSQSDWKPGFHYDFVPVVTQQQRVFPNYYLNPNDESYAYYNFGVTSSPKPPVLTTQSSPKDSKSVQNEQKYRLANGELNRDKPRVTEAITKSYNNANSKLYKARPDEEIRHNNRDVPELSPYQRNQYENVFAFADPNFDFDKFLDTFREPERKIVTTTPAVVKTSATTEKVKTTTSSDYYEYYEDEETEKPKAVKTEKPVAIKTTTLSDDYYYDEAYDEVEESTKVSEKKNSFTSTPKFSAKFNKKEVVKPVLARPVTYEYAYPVGVAKTFPLTTTSTSTIQPPVYTVRQRIANTTKATTRETTKGKQRLRLSNTTDYDTKSNNTHRLEDSSVGPQKIAATVAPKTVHNGSQHYDPARYEQYYFYDDDIDTYRDLDYSQHYNANNADRQTFRGTPATTSHLSSTPKESTKRRPTYIQSSYTAQDVYPSADYNEDNTFGQVDDQSSYRQTSQQPSRGDRNELNYVEEPSTTKRAPTITRTTTTTTTTTTPRPIPSQKSTVPSRSPVRSNVNSTRAQLVPNTLPEDPGHILPSTTLFPNILSNRKSDAKTEQTYKHSRLDETSMPAVTVANLDNTSRSSTTPKPMFHFITKASKAGHYSFRERERSSSNRMVTTYAPPKFIPSAPNNLSESRVTNNPNANSFSSPSPLLNASVNQTNLSTNKKHVIIKMIRKFINPIAINNEFSGTTDDYQDSSEEDTSSERPKTLLHVKTTTQSATITKNPLFTQTSTTTTITPTTTTTSSKLALETTARVDKIKITEKLRYHVEPSLYVAPNNKQFHTTVEIPEPRDVYINEEDLSKPEPDQPPSYKPKPVPKIPSVSVTKPPQPEASRNTTIPARVSRVNTAIKSLIAFVGTRRPNTKCTDNQKPNVKCNDVKQRTSSRGRGSAHYSSAGIVEPVNVNTVNRGTAPPRSRPTLKPSTSIVSKAAEYIDIYRYPPRRPETIYPQPQPDKTAAKCRKDVCLLPDCYCGGKEIPGNLPVEEVPQMVLVTFDDAVNDLNTLYYAELFENGRVNPNGCPIAATFYVSHEWTDYSQVQNLYADGHEMASHTVSHSFGEQFSQKKWTREVAGQREILSAYGGVKLEDVRGMRAPFLSVGGNKMFKMLYDSNFTYDSSMPIYENKPPSWPYTLDYKLFHDCMIPPCPTRSYPGVWEVPMVMWQDLNGGRCSMGDACSNPPESEGVFKLLMKNFQRHYTTNRAPFGLFYHAAWFTQPHHKEGFINFLDAINAMKDVYLVTNWQAIQWVREPTPLSQIDRFQPFQCNYPDRPKRCNNPKVCNLWHKSGVRYMRTCQPCPDIYPWTGNTGIRSSRIDNDIED